MAYSSAAVSNTAIAFQKPITLQQGRALRDNPLEMFLGGAGAPRLQFEAMDAWYSTPGAVGSLALLAQTAAVSTDIVAGTSYAGSALAYAGFHFTSTTLGAVGASSGTALSGTWKALGSVAYSTSLTQRATLFIRIA